MQDRRRNHEQQVAWASRNRWSSYGSLPTAAPRPPALSASTLLGVSPHAIWGNIPGMPPKRRSEEPTDATDADITALEDALIEAGGNEVEPGEIEGPNSA